MFFIAPGPLTFDLFERGFDARTADVAGVVLVGTGDRRPARPAAGLRAGALHHPVHRGSAESAVSPRLLHDGVGRGRGVRGAEHRRPGLGRRHRRVAAEADVRGRVLPDRRHGLAARRAWDCLPRVKPSTQGEGHERRYFYGSVWAVAIAQPVLWLLWKVAARRRASATSSSSSSSSASSRSSASCRASACCRARGRSCRASWRCRD